MKVIQKNKKATYDYEILEKFMAGLILTGAEVKSVRQGNVNLKGSYVVTSGKTLMLKGANISPYKQDSTGGHEPMRERELLLSKKEIEKIKKALNEQGITVVPLVIGLVGPYIKLEIGLGRGKKKHDKREAIKERSINRNMQRIMRR